MAVPEPFYRCKEFSANHTVILAEILCLHQHFPVFLFAALFKIYTNATLQYQNANRRSSTTNRKLPAKSCFRMAMTTPSKLLRQRAENKWSVTQYLEHLNSYGHYYLPAIEKSIEKATRNRWSSSEEYTPGWLGNYFTNLMLYATAGKKMKKMSAPKNHSPIAALNSDQVLSEL
ncbi:MAG: DinB family protein [Segetibacter sp.]|nr:DinB family protein [Segetibacter sp.]